MATAQRYNQPEKGTTDWHIPLNENFADLDTDISNAEDAIDALTASAITAAQLDAELAGYATTGHDHSGGQVNPDALGGGVVNRTEPVTDLSGNTYVVPEGAPDPTQADGDIVLYYE